MAPLINATICDSVRGVRIPRLIDALDRARKLRCAAQIHGRWFRHSKAIRFPGSKEPLGVFIRRVPMVHVTRKVTANRSVEALRHSKHAPNELHLTKSP